MALRLLLDKLSFYLDAKEVSRVERAYKFAEKCHEGQMRQSGDAYISHPLAVAHILADMRMDHESLMAAMLHDVIEDTGVTKGQISRRFGRPVLVFGTGNIYRETGTSSLHHEDKSFHDAIEASFKNTHDRKAKAAAKMVSLTKTRMREMV